MIGHSTHNRRPLDTKRPNEHFHFVASSSSFQHVFLGRLSWETEIEKKYAHRTHMTDESSSRSEGYHSALALLNSTWTISQALIIYSRHVCFRAQPRVWLTQNTIFADSLLAKIPLFAAINA